MDRRLIVPLQHRTITSSERESMDAAIREALRLRHLDLARRQWHAGYRETAVMHAGLAGVAIEDVVG